MFSGLADKTVIISGGGGALGEAVARRLHSDGMKLALLDRSEEALQRVQTALQASDTAKTTPPVLTGIVDLTDAAAVEAFVEKTVTAFGQIDALVNIAGGFAFSGPVHEMDLSQVDAMFTINVKTAFTLSAAVAKRLVAAGDGGRIVNISARSGLRGETGMAAYTASKAAVLRLTESMAAELSAYNVTVNAVLPSTIDTLANRHAMPDADFRNWVSPNSLAGVIAFLLSDAARDISGASIPVYGRA